MKTTFGGFPLRPPEYQASVGHPPMEGKRCQSPDSSKSGRFGHAASRLHGTWLDGNFGISLEPMNRIALRL